jgi:hypothetical protein
MDGNRFVRLVWRAEYHGNGALRRQTVLSDNRGGGWS